MNTNQLRFGIAYAQPFYNACTQRLDFYVRQGDTVAAPVELREIDQHSAHVPPTFSLTDDAAQALIDSLWRCGYRPRDTSSQLGALAATERHLEDMRRLYFQEVGLPDANEA